MRLDRKVTRLAASVLATAMFVCGAALPASAANNGGTIGVSEDTTGKFLLTSELRVPENIASPQVKFTYTIATGTVDPDGEEWGAVGSEVEVYAGETNGLLFVATDPADPDQTIGSDALTNAVTYQTAAPQAPAGEATYYTLSKNLTLKAQVNAFKHAGVYKYTLTATQTTTVPDVTVDNTVRNVYVYVKNNTAYTGYEIAAVTMAKADNTQAKTETFTHSYLFEGDNPDPESKSAQLLLSKTVTGAFGNRATPFDFTVTVSNSTGTKYHYVLCNWDEAQGKYIETTTTGLIDKDGTSPIKLQHNQAIKIYGLQAGDGWNIVEAEAPEYTTTIEASSGTPDNSTRTANGSVVTAEDDITVKYTNDRANVTPTGVLLNVAPYALMVIIAVAAAFVFLRKRRDD